MTTTPTHTTDATDATEATEAAAQPTGSGPSFRVAAWDDAAGLRAQIDDLAFLRELAARGSYPELVAGVLPCFWVYDDVGTRLRASVALENPPYADWISTYGDPEFSADTATARQITDQVAAEQDAATVQRMHAVFRRATQYEWMFRDSAHHHEDWPVR